MEVSLLTNLVPSSLLVQATFVPVSYDCSCGQLMKNLSKRENKPKTVNLWGLNGCQVSNRLIRNFNQQISASQLLPTTDKGLHSKAQHIKSSKYLLYVKFSVRKKILTQDVTHFKYLMTTKLYVGRNQLGGKRGKIVQETSWVFNVPMFSHTRKFANLCPLSRENNVYQIPSGIARDCTSLVLHYASFAGRLNIGSICLLFITLEGGLSRDVREKRIA